MKWTTANIKNPDYTQNHEIYVGTQTGSFKKLLLESEENPFAEKNLLELSKLDKDSRITSLSFGNAEKTEILVGHAHNRVDVHSLQTGEFERAVELKTSPVVGLARYEDILIAGFSNGKIQHTLLDQDNSEEYLLNAGDDMSHLRQCATDRHLIATGGKGRQNNLKIYDMLANGKQIFSSKNVPNDYLQLEVPVWDSDVGFIDGQHTLATCSRHGYVRVYDTRKQRRPVHCFATEEHMSFTSLTAHGNYIYTGTTIGALKAFDIRAMKNFVHTYKGFTGGISDLCLDDTGKYLASSSLDRYVRVHDVDSCVLQYQCYVKSKATRILIRGPIVNKRGKENSDAQDIVSEPVTVKGNKKRKGNVEQDDEYDAMFDNMQTICEKDDNEVENEVDNLSDEDDDDDNDDVEETKSTQHNSNTKLGTKRKSKTNVIKNKKKKN